jgi:hypothetical protein
MPYAGPYVAPYAPWVPVAPWVPIPQVSPFQPHPYDHIIGDPIPGSYPTIVCSIKN